MKGWLVNRCFPLLKEERWHTGRIPFLKKVFCVFISATLVAYKGGFPYEIFFPILRLKTQGIYKTKLFLGDGKIGGSISRDAADIFSWEDQKQKDKTYLCVFTGLFVGHRHIQHEQRSKSQDYSGIPSHLSCALKLYFLPGFRRWGVLHSSNWGPITLIHAFGSFVQ